MRKKNKKQSIMESGRGREKVKGRVVHSVHAMLVANMQRQSFQSGIWMLLPSWSLDNLTTF